MATNFKNDVYKYYSNVKNTVPAASTKTGTIQTVGKMLVGTGTLFQSELQVGAWVCDFSQDEIRKVIDITDDTKALLSNAFTVNIPAATALTAISYNDAKTVSIAVQIPATAATDAEVDGEVMPKGTSISFSKDSRDISGQNDSVDPIIVDATGTVAQVMYQR